ncbi:hypothetical protein AB3N59_04915 [Leptospira sp. WS92.C1]
MNLSKMKLHFIGMLILFGILFVSCEEEKAQTQDALTSLIIGQSVSAINENSSQEEEFQAVLLSVTPAQGSLKLYSAEDQGIVNGGGVEVCEAHGFPADTLLEDGEYVRIRQIRPTTPGNTIIDAIFDRPVTSNFFRLSISHGTGGVGLGTFSSFSRPDANTIRFDTAMLNHRFPGISRISTDSPTGSADNEIRFNLMEMTNGGATFGRSVLEWKSSEKFDAPYDFNAKISFDCNANGCFANAKYRLPALDNYKLSTDVTQFNLTVRLRNPVNTSQVIGEGRITLPACYFVAKTNHSDVWFYETRVKLNDVQPSFTPQDLANGNYRVEIRNSMLPSTILGPGPSANYFNSDIIRE